MDLHPPEEIFTIERGVYRKNHPFRGYSKGDGCLQKWTPPQKCSNVFLVGWDPSEQKMLAFFSIMGALLVDSDVVIDRYCNSFRY